MQGEFELVVFLTRILIISKQVLINKQDFSDNRQQATDNQFQLSISLDPIFCSPINDPFIIFAPELGTSNEKTIMILPEHNTWLGYVKS